MNNEAIYAATTVKSWNVALTGIQKLLSSLKDEDFQREVAPGRNRIYYLVGHLAAVHDRLLPMLALGERLHPELDDIFISHPDRALADKYSGAELRQMFAEINAAVTKAIETMPPADLLKRHEAVSAEDFEKDPLRNRLSVFQSRTAHISFHAGQIRLAV
jgi:DinB superfamily